MVRIGKFLRLIKRNKTHNVSSYPPSNTYLRAMMDQEPFPFLSVRREYTLDGTPVHL